MSGETLAAVATVVASAIATAILRWSAYRWPTGYHDARAVSNAAQRRRRRRQKKRDEGDR